MPIGWLAVPPLLALVAWLPFVAALRRGRRVTAAVVVAVWAVLLAVALGMVEHRAPGTCARWFPRAAESGEAMLSWARTGVGCQSQPLCFLPRLVIYAAIFAAGTAATGGYLGLLLAAVVFGWMGAYTGGLAAGSAQPTLAAAVGWSPWAVIGAAGSVALGVALAEPLVRLGLARLPGWRRWLLAGVGGLVAAALLETLLASTWWSLAVHPLVR